MPDDEGSIEVQVRLGKQQVVFRTQTAYLLLSPTPVLGMPVRRTITSRAITTNHIVETLL
jgi:hypothetical protein